jgi:hypothetical protein
MRCGTICDEFSSVQLGSVKERRRKDGRGGNGGNEDSHLQHRQTDAVLCCVQVRVLYKGIIRLGNSRSFFFPTCASAPAYLRICIKTGIYVHHSLETEPVHVIIQLAS